MRRTVQQEFAIRVKVALVERGLSVSALAGMLTPPRPRPSVSAAIHHGRFPRIRKQIEKVLSV